jgi:protein-S-isoprenylcysteine O-methyltransferase Ste14
MLNLELKVPPAVVALSVAGLMWLASTAAPPLAVQAAFRICVASALATCGVVVIIGAGVGFRRARTTVNPTAPGRTTHLVHTSIYRFSRNPMYLGMMLILLGWAVVLSSPLSLGLSAAFVLYMNRFQIPAEERMLLVLFRQEYSDYLRKVR